MNIIIAILLCCVMGLSLFLFGTVELWSFCIMQIIVAIIALITLLKGIFDRNYSISHFYGSIILLIIIGIIFFQMIPLPSGIVYSMNPEKKELVKKADETLLSIDSKLSLSNYGVKRAIQQSREEINSKYARYITLSIARSKLGLLRWLVYFLLFVSVLQWASNRRQVTGLILFIVIMGFAASFVGFCNHFLTPNKILWIRETTSIIFFAPFYNENTFSAYELMVLPLALGVIFSVLRKGKYFHASRESRIPLILIYSLMTVIIFVGIMFSLSRAGMIFSIIAFLFMVIAVNVLDRGRLMLILSLIMVIFVIGVLIWIGLAPVKEEMSTLKEEVHGKGTLASRIVAWQHGLALLNVHSLAGTGQSTFSLAFQKYSPLINGRIDRMHNDYLQLLIENGPVAFMSILLIIILYFAKIFRCWGALASQTQKIVVLSLVTSVSIMLLMSFADFHLQIGAVGVLFTILAALGFAVAMNYEHQKDQSGVRIVSVVIILIAVGAVLYYSVPLLRYDLERLAIQSKALPDLNNLDEQEMNLFAKSPGTPGAYYLPAKRKLICCVKEVDIAINSMKKDSLNLYFFDTKWRTKLNNHLQSIVDALLKAIVLEPNNSEYWIKLGQTLELIEWVEDLTVSIDIEQLTAKGTHQVGELSMAAENIYKTAIELDPLNIDAYQGLGKLYYKNGRLREAQAILKRYIVIRPYDDYFYKVVTSAIAGEK